MKVAPEQIIINFELQKFKQKIFLISGNEETYIKKIEESLICGLKNTIKTEIILSDIDIIQKKLEKSKKKFLNQKEIHILEKKLEQLNQNQEASIDNED